MQNEKKHTVCMSQVRNTLSPYSHTAKYVLESAKQVGALYHYTSFFNLLSILEKDKLQRGPTGYVSFTRNRYFHRLPGLVGVKTDVRIQTDGDVLSEKYRLEPYKYHGLDLEVPYESEERTLRTISSFKQYVKGVTLFKDRWPDRADLQWPKFEIPLSRYLGIGNVTFEIYVRYIKRYNLPIDIKLH